MLDLAALIMDTVHKIHLIVKTLLNIASFVNWIVIIEGNSA